MMVDPRACFAGALALCAALAGPLAARDVYRGFLDPGIPQHRATLDLLERLVKTPNDASLHNDLACLIARDGFWRDALREFALAAKLDKAASRPLYNAGLVHAMRGEWGSAASAFRKAVSRAPGNWPAWWMLGYAEERRGHESAAIAAYKTSLRVDTSLFDVRRNPFVALSRLKGRVLLETLEGRVQRLALPATEQMAQADLVTSFQQGRVVVSAVPGGPVPAGAQAPIRVWARGSEILAFAGDRQVRRKRHRRERTPVVTRVVRIRGARQRYRIQDRRPGRRADRAQP